MVTEPMTEPLALALEVVAPDQEMEYRIPEHGGH